MFSTRMRVGTGVASPEAQKRAAEAFLDLLRSEGAATAGAIEEVLVEEGVKRGPSYQIGFRILQKLRVAGLIRFEDKRWKLV